MIKTEILEVLALIEGSYPNMNPTENTVESWHVVLGCYDKREVMIATAEYLREGHDFYPNPGQIAQRIIRKKAPALFESFAAALASGGNELSDYALAQARGAQARGAHAIGPRDQFRSPEDLAEAKRINESRVMRAAKEIYEQKVDKTRTLIAVGHTVQDAITEVIGMGTHSQKMIGGYQ